MITSTEKKMDLFALYKAEYAAKNAPSLIQTVEALYLAIEGTGEPGGETFSEATAALYGMAYTIKMRWKFSGQQDYTIGKLEALWPQASGESMLPKDRTTWKWRMMIRTPDFISQKELNESAALLIQRGKSPSVRKVELFSLHEGSCVQALHKGPYDSECTTIERMRRFAQDKGLAFTRAHHEIYLSDPRRVTPEKLRTILRHPCQER